MPDLQPASLISKLASYMNPKCLRSAIRSEVIETGEVEITPIFTIDGNDVPANLVKPVSPQNILGYTVILDEAAIHIHRQTQCKPTRLVKGKAAAFIKQLSAAGVTVLSRDEKSEPRVESVKPDLALELTSDDSLYVKSVLNTSSGIIIDKPQDVDQLHKDDGWYSLGDDLFRIETTGTFLDPILIAPAGIRTLEGDDVPLFLKALDDHTDKLGEVAKNSFLEDLAVYSDAPERVAKVDGDAESISITPSLVFRGKSGRRLQSTPQDLEHFEAKKGGFKRVSEGWIEVSADALETFQSESDILREKLGSSENITGSDIPKAICKIREAATHGLSLTTPWTVYFSEAVKNSHRVIDSHANVEFRLNIVESDGRALLQLDPIYNHDRFALTYQDVEDAVQANENFVRRQNAWIKIDREKNKKINSGASRLNLQREDGGFRFPASQREKVIEIFSVIGTIEHSEAYASFVAKLADFTKIEDSSLPLGLRPEISFRPYQKHGFNWLAFLYKFGLNGILADDMGLGKTLQTLAVIQKAKESSRANYPSLIICPTSVVSNWKSEAFKFFKDCDVLIYTGNLRQRKLADLKEALETNEILHRNLLVITSYDIARTDFEKLNQVPWMYVVVDEGHNIKNPNTKRTKAIKTLNGQHKLALTGTPIQNNLEELWSLFDFVMPGFLGSQGDFAKRYGKKNAINWEALHSKKTSLRDKVHPFIMRRMKDAVAQDLPAKIIIELKVELSPKQVTLYKQINKTPEFQRAIVQIDEKGIERAHSYIFSALAKLRAICNHPILASESLSLIDTKYEDSGKLDALKELMDEVVAGNHRSLLFSQSTQMLDLIEHFFTEWKIEFLRLDGSTTAASRPVLVDEFNRNEKINCFLISTKAGGTGLNLTGADTAIFYDHDWNPANDLQAQDRAYRIGQTKPVTVYKLISKGTIEEKIIERQTIKQSLADQIIGVDDQGFKNLTKQQLLELFTLDETN